MATILDRRIQKGVKAKVSVSADGNITRTGTITERVTVDAAIDPAEVIDLLGFQAGEPHPYDGRMTLREVDATEEGTRDPWNYLVVRNYSNEAQSKESPSEDPLDDPIDVEWDTIDATRYVEKDLDGEAILTTSKGPIDGGVELSYRKVQVTYVRSEVGFSGARARLWVNSTNTNTFSGAEPGKLLIARISAKQTWKNGFKYDRVTYVIIEDEFGWKPEYLNADLYQLDDDGKRIRIRDAEHQDVTEVQPLDNDGKVIPEASLPGAEVYLQPRLIKELDFSVLGLPE